MNNIICYYNSYPPHKIRRNHLAKSNWISNGTIKGEIFWMQVTGEESEIKRGKIANISSTRTYSFSSISAQANTVAPCHSPAYPSSGWGCSTYPTANWKIGKGRPQPPVVVYQGGIIPVNLSTRLTRNLKTSHEIFVGIPVKLTLSQE